MLLAAADTQSRVYTIQTIAGSDFSGDDGLALAAAFSQTEGVAVDILGTIYVADAGDNRVRKITPDGVIQTVAGTGVAGFSGDGGQAGKAQLNHPYGIAVDSQRNLYIADFGNARIRKVTSDGIIQTLAGGGIIIPGANGDGSLATSMQLMQPRNIAVQPDGSFYLSDFGANRVYRVASNGSFTTVAGTGNAGFSGDNAAAVLAQLKAPAGVACDPNGALYIADSGNNRVRKVLNGVISTIFSVTGPTGVAVNANGTVYIAAAAYFGTQYRATTGIAAGNDVTFDAAGNVYASTGQYVRKAALDGKVTTVAGSGISPFFGGDTGPASKARMHAPSGIAIDESGNLYVADSANNRIRKITAGGTISTIAGTGTAGSAGDNGPATQAQLNAPASVAIDSTHTLYIADAGNNRIRKITPAGTILPVVTQLNNPVYVAVDVAGNIYVADNGNNRVLKISQSGSVTTLVQVLKPAGVTVDSDGNAYVSEATRVSKVSPAGALTTVLDGLNSPAGLALTQDGGLLIAETGLNVIRKLTSSGVLTVIAGTGAYGFAGDGGLSTQALLNAPADVVTDLTGTTYIADSVNNRIRMMVSTVVADEVASLTVVSSATMAGGPIAPGEIVTIYGTGFEPNQTQLLFDGIAATVFYADAMQINALAPLNLRPNFNTEVSVAVKGTRTGAVSPQVVSSAPGFFTFGYGSGQAAANNEDGSINSVSNPAARGSIMSLWATGEGADISAVSLKIAGYTAELLYAGPAPGFPGLMQINGRIPAGFAPSGILPIVLTVGTSTTQDGVTIAVR